ncbi:Palmitoyltransferase pfa5 [Maublancomyces gigas]|uniref:Palmitoyltransferase pfa5 n=1 Tax=Discina gigas TaxID=1032678 RepID=A0ABR3GNP3_9PEZI
MGLRRAQRDEGLLNFGNAETPRPGTAASATGYNEFLDPKNMPRRESATGDLILQPPDLDPALPSPVFQQNLGHRVSETPSSNMLLPPIIHQDRPRTSSTVQGHAYDSYEHRPVPLSERPEPETLREWYSRDVFVCEPDGPIIAARVGGVVAETSYKFFYQVVVYGSIYCFFLIISLAIFVREQIVNSRDIDPNWVAALALSCLFGLFSAGMAGSTTQLIYRNLSTVDALSHTVKVYQLAIYDPSPPQQPPLGPRQVYSPLVPRVWLPTTPIQGQQQRCFAIVKTRTGENPWRLGSTMDNFKEVLGYNIWDWWLPLKGSPLVNKDSALGWYRWNEELLNRLRREAGIEIGTAP